MNITRRNFFIGGVAGALGAFGGNRFFASAGLKADGKPKLRFGVVSDIHIRYVGADGKMEGKNRNNLTFKHTLEWFRDQNVDVVMIAGDMADQGMDEQLLAVAQAWYAVFPDDKYPNGRPVTKMFVTGNHDWDGFTYRDAAKKAYPDEQERAKHILRKDMAGWWEKAFHESYSPIFSKTVNGYTFIGSHWDSGTPDDPSGKKTYPFGRIEDFMAKNGKSINPALPFFYVQHPHPMNTCYGPWAWGHDKGIVTKTLSAYPNAVAFSGHSHYTLTDERSIWQGAFTSVGTCSLRYTGTPYYEHPPAGFENSASVGARTAWRQDSVKMMAKIPTFDCRQGMLWSVYEDCIVVKRREFLSNLDLGDDWVMPLPAAESKPFAFAEHAKKFHAPEFMAGSELTVTRVKTKTRGGRSRDGKEKIKPAKKAAFRVATPLVVPDKNARLFKLEFVAETANGKKVTKLTLAPGFNHSLTHPNVKDAPFCQFALDELGKGDIRFTATPINCFGQRGKSISATAKI